MFLSSSDGVLFWFVLVEGAVAHHGVEDVAASPGEGEQDLVVLLPLAKLAVAIEHELTHQTITHTPTKEAAMLILA